MALNILVASIGSWQFWRAGHFSWSLFWPFAVLSVPFAFLGGYLNLPTQVFKIVTRRTASSRTAFRASSSVRIV